MAFWHRPTRHHPGDIGAEGGQPGAVGRALGLVHKQRRSYLDDDALRVGQSRHGRHPPGVSSTASSSPALPDNYEAALQELEQLVARLESGQMPLDELLVGYRRGAALLALCKDKLQAVEDQIKVLDGGQLKSWDAA